MKTHALDISVIPKGCYCYTYVNEKIAVCPYWSMNKNYPKQNNGFCKFLNMGDWDLDGCSLLWDQVKECHINNQLNEEDL